MGACLCPLDGLGDAQTAGKAAFPRDSVRESLEETSLHQSLVRFLPRKITQQRNGRVLAFLTHTRSDPGLTQGLLEKACFLKTLC